MSSSLGNLKVRSFEEADVEKTAELLNFIGKHAKFTLDVQEVIKFYGLLSHTQSVILPKMKQSIMGDVKVHAPAEPAKPAAPAKQKATRKASK